MVVSLVACGSRSGLLGSASSLEDDADGGSQSSLGGLRSEGGLPANAGADSRGGTFSDAGTFTAGGSVGGSPPTGGTLGSGGVSSGGTQNVGGISNAGDNAGGVSEGGASSGGENAGGAPPWTPPFVSSFGDQQSQVALGVATAKDGAWVTGYFWGNLELDGSGPVSEAESDVFLRHVDNSGTVTQTHAFGGPNRQEPSAILVADSGDVIVGGSFKVSIDLGNQTLQAEPSFDGFVARFDDHGNVKSAFRYGDNSNQYVHDLAFAKNGDVLALGYYGLIKGFSIGSTPITNQGSGDWMVVRLDQDSAPLSVHTYGNAGVDYPSALAVGPDGTTWVVGTFSKAVDYGCGELHAFGKADMFVIGLDEQGKCLKSTSIGNAADDQAGDIAVDSKGNLIVTGSVYGPFQIATQLGTDLTQYSGYFVLGLTPDLKPRFVHVMSNNGWVAGAPLPYGPNIPRLAVDADDHVWMAGGFAGLMTIDTFQAASAGDADMFYLEMASDGSAIGGKICGDGQRQVAYGLSAGPALNFVVGAFQGTMTDCVSAKVSSGAEDAFVLGIEP